MDLIDGETQGRGEDVIRESAWEERACRGQRRQAEKTNLPGPFRAGLKKICQTRAPQHTIYYPGPSFSFSSAILSTKNSSLASLP
jgi:hypothetical protein